jgi:hypothetical protein
MEDPQSATGKGLVPPPTPAFRVIMHNDCGKAGKLKMAGIDSKNTFAFSKIHL